MNNTERYFKVKTITNEEHPVVNKSNFANVDSTSTDTIQYGQADLSDEVFTNFTILESNSSLVTQAHTEIEDALLKLYASKTVKLTQQQTTSAGNILTNDISTPHQNAPVNFDKFARVFAKRLRKDKNTPKQGLEEAKRQELTNENLTKW